MNNFEDVQRLDVGEDGWNLWDAPDGRFVSYDDYEKLLNEYIELKFILSELEK